MIVHAAIDLRQGRVVQLIGGRPEAERISLPNPVAVAVRFVEEGFESLHVIDLDAALGEGSNGPAVREIIGSVGVPVQFGGGVRDTNALRAALLAGATRVIVGTRAITDFDWLAEASRAHPRRVLVAADTRGETIVTHGWRQSTSLAAADFFDQVGGLPLAGLLVTDVTREGSLAGIDAAKFARMVAATDLPIIAAGGVGSIQDLRDLDGAGVAGAVVGTALYTGAIDPGAAAKEFKR